MNLDGLKTYIGIGVSTVGQLLKASGYNVGVDELVSGTGADVATVFDRFAGVCADLMAYGGLVMAAYGRFVARLGGIGKGPSA